MISNWPGKSTRSALNVERPRPAELIAIVVGTAEVFCRGLWTRKDGHSSSGNTTAKHCRSHSAEKHRGENGQVNLTI